MKLIPTRHLWGITETWEAAFPRFVANGYAAIEIPVQWMTPADGERLRRLSAAHGLAIIPQLFTEGATVAEHVNSFRRIVAIADTFAPLLINVHSGRDAWSHAEAVDFYRQVARIEADHAVIISHETHRGRPMFSPWATRDLLLAVPELRLTADFSHWVCVAERLVLDEEPELLRLVADHTVHLHARVGYGEGPQVPDPRAPEYLPEVEAHERWWTVVWERMAAVGRTQFTLTPEFGPGRYLHHLPYTDVPVADLDAICNWQMARQQAHYQAWSRARGG
jgi:sugar phosphate isomerase/epimerase